MKKVISVILIISVLFGFASCSAKEEDNVTKMLKAFEDEDFVEFKNCAAKFFSGDDSEALYTQLCDALDENSISFGSLSEEDDTTTYNAMLWVYIFTYFYDEDVENLIDDCSKAISMMDECKKLFRYSEEDDKYYYATAFFGLLPESDELRTHYFDALSLYYLTADSVEKEKMSYALSMENTKELHDVYFNLQFFTKGNAIETTISSGDGETGINNKADIISFSEKVLGNSVGEECVEFYDAYPVISERKKGDIFVYKTKSYTVAYYGNPVYAYTIHDSVQGTVLNAKVRNVQDTEYYVYSH